MCFFMFCTSKNLFFMFYYYYPKTWVLDLHWIKFRCYADFKMLYGKKSLTISESVHVKKSLIDKTCIFHERWKKLKTFYGVPRHSMGCLQTNKQNFWQNVLLIFFNVHEKTNFLLFQDFLHIFSDIVNLPYWPTKVNIAKKWVISWHPTKFQKTWIEFNFDSLREQLKK